jgi:hypothetical protein
MKKFLLTLLLVFVSSWGFAQTQKYTATSVAFRVYENDVWSDWSDWEDVSILVVFSMDRQVVTIYSKETQEYDFYDMDEEPVVDDSGGESWVFHAVNADGLRCDLRLRKHEGSWQLYVDFKDMMWVYNIKPKN